MVYCQKCGKKNEDDAEFCSKCGASLKVSAKDYEKHKEDRCEEECVAGKKSPFSGIFWGLIVIIVGLWIIFGLVIPETTLRDSLPSWLVEFNFWWVILLIVALAIIGTGIRIIVNK